MSGMELKSLNFDRDTYGPTKGMLCGKATFTSPSGVVEYILTDYETEQILKICADRLTVVLKAKAEGMVMAVADGLKHARNVEIGSGLPASW